jgi:hypothetical protein
MKLNPFTPSQQHVLFDSSSPESRSQSLPSRGLATPVTQTIAQSKPATVNPNNPFRTETNVVATNGSKTPKAIHPRLASLPPPMMARYQTQGSARLTPSIRQQPMMPILNLPPLPPPTPTPAPPTPAQMSSPMRLRSMPALPMRGPSDMGLGDADHGNASLDEMDEMDVMEEEEEETAEHLSDEEEDSPPVEVAERRVTSPLPPSLSRNPRAELPVVDTSQLGIQFGTPTPGAPAVSEAQRVTMYFTPSEPVLAESTPIPSSRSAALGPSMDYFNSKLPEKAPARADLTRTPRPTDYRDSMVVPRTVPMPHDSPRPGLYSQASKSMVDLMSISRKQAEKEIMGTEKKQNGVPDYVTANSRDTPREAAGPSNAKQSPAPPLRRRRSLPMFTTSTEPPPYPSFSPPRNAGSLILPREEEGKEKLPSYTNHIYLAAVMPRKMEFTAPGFQAKDRKWKRALCILEGTMLKIYRVHNGVVEDWWERTVGVGDKTSIDPVALGPSGVIRVSGVREAERQQSDPVKGSESSQPRSSTADRPSASPTDPSSQASTHPSSSRSRLSNILHPRRSDKHDRQGAPSASSSRSRMSLDMVREEQRASSAPRRRSMDSARLPTPSPTTSSSALSSTRRASRTSSSEESFPTSRSPSTLSRQSSSQSQTPAVSHFSMLSSSEHMPVQEPDYKDLVRKYTLQHAESGLASDYQKRKNVIRVRMEGEQFLLQARDVPAVIEWIEVG